MRRGTNITRHIAYLGSPARRLCFDGSVNTVKLQAARSIVNGDTATCITNDDGSRMTCHLEFTFDITISVRPEEVTVSAGPAMPSIEIPPDSVWACTSVARGVAISKRIVTALSRAGSLTYPMRI